MLEYACPVWGPEVHDIDYLSYYIEAVQKRATKIILGPKYDMYVTAIGNVETLRDRRFHLMCKFGQSLFASEKCNTLLPSYIPPKPNTRHTNKSGPNKMQNESIQVFFYSGLCKCH